MRVEGGEGISAGDKEGLGVLGYTSMFHLAGGERQQHCQPGSMIIISSSTVSIIGTSIGSTVKICRLMQQLMQQLKSSSGGSSSSSSGSGGSSGGGSAAAARKWFLTLFVLIYLQAITLSSTLMMMITHTSTSQCRMGTFVFFWTSRVSL